MILWPISIKLLRRCELATLRPYRIVPVGLGIIYRMKSQQPTPAMLVTPMEDARSGPTGAAPQSAQTVAP